MRNKLLLLSFLILSVSVLTVTAQEIAPAPKTISGGVLNGKATNLVKPAYPAAARAVRAEGAVNVQVTIDEEGNVISASAVSGHPLLRAAAVQAARASKFSPTILNGQAVKVTGVIVYNFVAGTTEGGPTRTTGTGNWFQTGMSISALETMPTLRFFEPNSLNYMIPADWTEERNQIKRLDELKKAEMETSQGAAPKERVIDERASTDANKTSVKTTTMTVQVSPERKVSPEVTAISQSLMSSIQGRLAANELNLWYFNLGINLNKALLNADSKSSEKRIDGVKPFRKFIENIPAGAPAGIFADLEKFASLAERGIFSDKDKIEITEIMTRLNPIPQN